jgi:hypothetical protein
MPQVDRIVRPVRGLVSLLYKSITNILSPSRSAREARESSRQLRCNVSKNPELTQYSE